MYKDRKCPRCYNLDESFNHVWTCPDRIMEIRSVAEEMKTKLIKDIIDYREINNLPYTNLAGIVNLQSIWEVEINNDQLTFIDIIKGIIPAELSIAVKEAVEKEEQVAKIISLNIEQNKLGVRQ